MRNSVERIKQLRAEVVRAMARDKQSRRLSSALAYCRRQSRLFLSNGEQITGVRSR